MNAIKIFSSLRSKVDTARNLIIIVPSRVVMVDLADKFSMFLDYQMRSVGVFCMKGQLATGYGVTFLVESLRDEGAIARLKSYLMGNAGQDIWLLDGCRMSEEARPECKVMAQSFRCTFNVLKVAE